MALLRNVPKSSNQPDGSAGLIPTGDVNETVSTEEATGTPLHPLSDGPRLGENGALLAARYELPGGTIREDR